MRMSSPWTARRLAPVTLAAAILAVGLTGCSSSGSGSKPEGAGSSGATSPAADKPTYDDYLKVPRGVHLTLRGSQLGFDEKATVAWQPAADVTAALTIKVTKVEKADIKVLGDWVLDKETKASQPYFVYATIVNDSKTSLENLQVPLYAVVGDGSYVQPSTFESEFKPCPGGLLPKKLKRGDKVKECWVYLAPPPGKLTGVSFYPGPWFEPIVWQGALDRYAPPKDDKKKKS